MKVHIGRAWTINSSACEQRRAIGVKPRHQAVLLAPVVPEAEDVFLGFHVQAPYMFWTWQILLACAGFHPGYAQGIQHEVMIGLSFGNKERPAPLATSPRGLLYRPLPQPREIAQKSDRSIDAARRFLLCAEL